MRVKHFVAGVIVTLIVAVGLAPVGAQQIMRIYGTVSGAPIALLANSSGVLRVALDGGSIPASTCAAPALSLSGGATTGIAFTATPSILNCISGTSVLTLTSTAVTSSVPLRLPNNTALQGDDAAAPAGYYDLIKLNASDAVMVGSASTQLSLATFSSIGFVFNGTERITLSGATNSVTLADNWTFGWSDVSLSRGAENRLDLATGDSFNIVSGYLSVGPTPSTITTAGSINIGNDARIIARNAANDSNLTITRMNTGNVVLLGDTNVTGVGFEDAAGVTRPTWNMAAPTIASGFGTSPSVVASHGTSAFTINVGTGGTASSGVITLPNNGGNWTCFVENITAVAANRADQRTVMTASTASSVTIQNQTVSTGAALAWTASDVLRVMCVGW